MSPHRVLLVIEQRGVRAELQTILQKSIYGIDLGMFSSGEEAILNALMNKVDLLIIDEKLPGVSGMDVLNNIKKHTPGVKSILLVDKKGASKQVKVNEKEWGAVLEKPLQASEALAVVKRLLAARSPEPKANPPEGREAPKPTPLIVKEPAVSASQLTVPEMIARLREELDAAAVLLLDASGRVLANAGEFPQGFDLKTLTIHLVSLLSAGNALSHIVGGGEHMTWHVFTGEVVDLVFAPTNPSRGILVAAKGAGEGLNVAATLEAIHRTYQDILKRIGREAAGQYTTPKEPPGSQEEMKPGGKSQGLPPAKGQELPTQVEVEEFWKKFAGKQATARGKTAPPPVRGSVPDKNQTPTGQEKKEESDLASLLEAKGKPPPREVEQFWEKAAGDNPIPSIHETLSYDQAKKMGLVGEENS